jgi:hypothetical protein
MVGSETGSVTFLLVKEDPDPNPDPKLGRKWDPDPKKIVSDPQHCWQQYCRIPILLCKIPVKSPVLDGWPLWAGSSLAL